jgi:hypothetical protein
MNRWVLFSICAIIGLVMLACGLLVPMHLRAVDASVIELAGQKTAALVDQGLALVAEKKLGPAQLLLQAARQERILGREKLDDAVGNLARQNPRLQFWGSSEPRLDILFGTESNTTVPAPVPFTDFVVREANRQKVLKMMSMSTRPLAQQLLQCRDLTNTVIFPAAGTSSGQAFDAALSICGLLLEENHLSEPLSNAVSTRVAGAKSNSHPFEQVLLDLMSLGQRLNWSQLAALVEKVDDPETLRLTTNLIRREEKKFPEFFSAVQLTGRPDWVVRYLMTLGQTGYVDLGTSLQFGAGGVKELLLRNQRLHQSMIQDHLAVDYCLHMPRFALTLKWFFYLAGGFLVAAALHYGRRPVSALERPFQVRGFHIAREVLFALGFLLVVLLLSEPFLAEESQKMEMPFRLQLPMVGSAAPAEAVRANPSFMNKLSLLTLLLFFVLQALLYTACLVKLAEIRKQTFPSRIKLRLLENEDHLFDAGLYLGFAGTIISLILVSLGVIKPSLMAAYSSTSFGIIFVSIFKIFHLRPMRRKLLLEAEAAVAQSVAASGARVLATSP